MRDLYLLPNLRASRVNLLMNDYAAGLPSPLALLGLADLIVRRIGLPPWSGRVIPVLHEVTPSAGRTKPEMEPDAGTFGPVEIIEDLTGTVELSLLLHLPGCERESAIRDALSGASLAGGTIQNDRVEVRTVTPDGSAFRGLRRGTAMVRPDQAGRRLISSGDLTPEQPGLAAIAEILFPEERGPGHGWLVPSAVGYRLIEEPETAPRRIRTRTRSVPHVFAEPVVGVAELISVRNPRLTGLTTSGLNDLFWGWEARGDLILGHPAYHPDHPSNRPEEALTHG